MNRARSPFLRLGGLALGSAAMIRIGLPVVVGTSFLVLVIIGAICWTISNGDRADRLALLISAARGQASRLGTACPRLLCSQVRGAVRHFPGRPAQR